MNRGGTRSLKCPLNATPETLWPHKLIVYSAGHIQEYYLLIYINLGGYLPLMVKGA